MVLDPRSPSTIYDELQTELTDSFSSLTNFLDSGFNDAWISAYSQQLYEAEVRALAAELAGWVDYAGKSNLTQDDLDRLGVQHVDPDDVADYLDDQQLDELAKLVGVTRDPGTKASGQVTFEVSTDSVEIPEGYEIGTEQATDGSYKSFYVDADEDGTIEPESDATVSPDAGATTVTAEIIAESVGDEYNVPAGKITFIPNPKPGIEGVSNGADTTGGASEQSNESFRNDIKNAVFAGSGGGTAKGLIGKIEGGASEDVDVALDQMVNQNPPFVDVIVDGGKESELKDLIADGKPVGIEHNLVRPKVTNLTVETDIVGSGIDSDDQSYIKKQTKDLMTDLSLSDEYRRSRLVSIIHNADRDIIDIGSLTITATSVARESAVYQTGTSIYELDFAPLGHVEREEHLYDSGTSVYDLAFAGVTASSVTLSARVNGDYVELVRGTDYSVTDTDGDGNNDAVDFSIGGSNPDERTTFEVTYNHTDTSINSTITDTDGNSYSRGTDWDLVDNNGDGLNDSIDWSIGGSAPADATRFFYDYSPGRDVPRDLYVSKRGKIGPADNVTLSVFDPQA